ncbi:MAG: hypothetical protein B9S32_12250 [Verrucomicrobia bacterium Tous-C9LFEB]|nr:MAG: hypothetical protein B9S32_12250 [Verrucomicrobia bacterium Tous-C9LFEB]
MPYSQGVIYKFRDVQTHQAVPLPPGEYLIGREDDCPICIENTSVSRRHAKITNGEDGLWIEDLGSSNGTAVRGQLITERTAISVGEVIYFGPVCYRLEPEIVGEEAAATVPQPGLKPAGLRNLMRKTTDRVPLGSIRFDHVPASEAATQPPSAPTQEPVPVPAPSVAREKISSYPTITLPATRVAPAAPASTFTAPTPASVTAAEIPRASVPVAVTAPATEEEEVTSEGVSPLTLWMSFGAGVAVGLLLGIGIAYALFTLGRVGH